MVEKQHNMEVSSSHTAEEKDFNIKYKYKQIKQKNEEIKTEIYSQFLKQKPGNRNRLMTAFDYSTNKMNMSFFKPTTSTPKKTIDYKKVDFEVDTENVHELDQIEFYRHSSEMLYSTVVTKEMSATKIQNIVLNMQDEMKLDKAYLYAKDLRIKALEDLVLQVGYDPSNIQAA